MYLTTTLLVFIIEKVFVRRTLLTNNGLCNKSNMLSTLLSLHYRVSKASHTPDNYANHINDMTKQHRGLFDILRRFGGQFLQTITNSLSNNPTKSAFSLQLVASSKAYFLSHCSLIHTDKEESDHPQVSLSPFRMPFFNSQKKLPKLEHVKLVSTISACLSSYDE